MKEEEPGPRFIKLLYYKTCNIFFILFIMGLVAPLPREYAINTATSVDLL
jgi:hypothetical protein